MTRREILLAYREGAFSTTEALDKLREERAEPLRVPLSEGQKGLLALQKMNPHSSAYNVPICLRLHGAIEIAALEKACRLVLEQHPALAVAIREASGSVWQEKQPVELLKLEREDISALAPDAVVPYLQKAAKMPFQLERGPMMRAHVFSRTPDENLLLLVIHHIAFDGRSLEPFLDTFFSAYDRLVAGESPAAARLPVDFADFVTWEQNYLSSQFAAEDKSYWLEKLAGPLPVLELPTDHPRQATNSSAGQTYTRSLSQDLNARIGSFCALQRVNVSVLFLAAFKVLVHRYTGETDVIVGMPTMGRPEERFDSLVGFFVNTVALRSKVGREESFSSLLHKVQLTVVDALDHAAYPFRTLVRDLKAPLAQQHLPVFQVVFDYKGRSLLHPAGKNGNNRRALNAEPINSIRQEGEYEFVVEVWEKVEGIVIHFSYDQKLYEPATIARLASHLEALLESAIQDPERKIGALAMLAPEERRQCLAEWNNTATEYPQDKLIQQLFEEQAQKTPGAVAIACKGVELSYAELNQRGNQLAHHLRSLGVGAEVMVGICMERSLDMVVALLGILKAGGVFVPLDPEYPPDRLIYMLEDFGGGVLLTQSKVQHVLAGHRGQVVCVDQDWPQISQASHGNPEPLTQPDHLAYVMYTSGSTGKPKGTAVTHRSVVRLVRNTNYADLGSDQVFLQFAPISFDASTLEIWGALLNGARLEIMPPEEPSLEALAEIIRQRDVTTLWLTAGLFHLMVDHQLEALGSLRQVLAGGDVLSSAHVKKFLEQCPQTRLINGYGPTENTTFTCCYPIPHTFDGSAVPIGFPLSNTQVYILDQEIQLVPAGITGELYTGGAGLARGYVNSPELTAERFVPNPFSELPGQRLYRTGDLAKWRSDGVVEFAGRIDDQVKIRGFRIEPREIEGALNACEGIEAAALVVRQDASGTKRLIAGIVAQQGYALQAEDVRSTLQKRLPHYMVPASFVFLPVLPLTPNGKVDRKAILDCEADQAATKSEAGAPASNIEHRVLSILRSVLNTQDIDLDMGFFDAGGDSLLAMAATTRIKEELDPQFKVTSLFKFPTIRAISEHIAAGMPGTEIPAIPNGSGRSCNVSVDKVDLPRPSSPDYYRNSVAIIGISCQFPGGEDKNDFWDNLRRGRESVEILSPGDLRKLGIAEEIIGNPKFVAARSTIAGKDLFDAEFFKVSARDAQMMDPQLRHLLMHAWKAVEDAGYAVRNISDTAVYMSSDNASYQRLALTHSSLLADAQQYSSWALAQNGTIPAVISNKLGLKGPSVFVHSNCSSSLVALDSAFRHLLSGGSRYALVGAATLFARSVSGYLHQEGMNFSSDGHVRAFDAAADGMIVGEGAAVVLLKKTEDAIADGDHIYALIRGVSVNNDGADKAGFYAPSVSGQAQVIRNVLETTGIDPETISYVEAHGTGTRLGDPIEFAAINSVYRQFTRKKQFCGIGSVKTNIGHLGATAGLAGCIKLALGLQYREIPPSLHYHKSGPEIDFESSPFYIVDKLAAWPGAGRRRAALSSFGIGGTNTHAILEEAPEVPAERCAQSGLDPYFIPLSAKKPDVLRKYAVDLLDFISVRPHLPISGIAYTLQTGREAMDFRLVLFVSSMDDLKTKLSRYLAGDPAIEQCYYGEVKRNQDGIASLMTSGSLQQIIEMLVAQGKRSHVAELWASGAPLDWNILHSGIKPRRVSLPTYPFARERYWVPEAQELDWPVRHAHSSEGTHVTAGAAACPSVAAGLMAEMPPRPAPGSASNAYHQFDALLGKLMFAQLQAMGLFVHRHPDIAQWKRQSGFAPAYNAWLAETVRILTMRGYLATEDGVLTVVDPAVLDAHELWNEWAHHKATWLQDPGFNAWVEITEATLRELPGVLTGKALIAQVLFPRGSMERVEGLYKRNERFDYFNNILADAAVAYIEARIAREPEARIRILEIGAGTGSTSEVVLDRLHPVSACIDEYRYTDLSQAFLKHAEREYGRHHSFLQYQVLNAEIALAKQGLETGSYDLVIAANVLHATRNIRETLRNVKSALKGNGLLLLNELTINALSAHLTFGLTEGWWLSEDAELRMPGSPGLSPESWEHALGLEGFRQILFPARTAHPLGMQIIVAESDGVVQEADRSRDVAQAVSRKTKSSPENTAATNGTGAIESGANHGLLEKAQSALVQSASRLLAIPAEKLDLDREFNDFGFDSISLTSFCNSLNESYGLALAPTIFFEHSTLRKFAAFLLEGHASELAEKLGASPVKAVSMTPAPQKLQTSRQQFGGRHASFVKKADPSSEQENQSWSGLEPIAIIGMSGCFPEAEDIDAFWNNLKQGKDCMTEIPSSRWDWKAIFGDPAKEPGRTNVKWGAFMDGIDEFDPLFFGISPREAEGMDPHQRLLMMHVWKAIEDAGYSAQALSGSRTAIFVGTGGSGYESLYRRTNPAEGYSFTGFIPSIGPGRISYYLDLHGPSEPVETACSSSLVAIHRGILSILNDQCEMALAGGVNVIINPETQIGLSKAGMLAPDGRCKAFSADADGYARGEGIGILLLKRLSAAERDHDHIYAVIRGSAVNHGGRANSLTAPNPRAQAEVLKQAYQRACVDMRTVRYIEAHGTGTALGDPIEINALKAAFRELGAPDNDFEDRKALCGVGTVKSNIGHLELAAGVAGVIKVVLQMKHKTLVKSLHCDRINPYVRLEGSPFYIVQENEPWLPMLNSTGVELPRRAGISSFGAGGVNAHVVLEEYRPALRNQTPAIAELQPALIVFSARNEERLKEQVAAMVRTIESRGLDDGDLADMAYTLQVGREAMEERLALQVISMRQLIERLQAFLAREADIADLYRGNSKRHKETLAVLGADEDMAGTIDAWIKKGNYSRLLGFWAKGLQFDWNRLYAQDLPSRLALPTYPFAKEKYWIRAAAVPVSNAEPLVQANTSMLDQQQFSSTISCDEPRLAIDAVSRATRAVELMTFEEIWAERPAPTAKMAGTLICFVQRPEHQTALVEAVESMHPSLRLVFVSEGPALRRVSAQHYAIPAEDAGSYAAALQSIQTEHGAADALIYFWGVEDPRYARECQPILYLLQAVAHTEIPRVLLAGEISDPLSDCYFDSWIGFDRSLANVLPQTRVTLVGIDETTVVGQNLDEAARMKAWLPKLLAELNAEAGESVIYRAGRRHVARITATQPVGDIDVLRNGGTYLITGGCGGLGLLFAEYLAKRYAANLILTGRSPLSQATQQKIDSLAKAGGQPLYLPCDVCNLEEMQRALQLAEEKFGVVHGVIHAAGVASRTRIAEKDPADFQQVLGPKITGTLVLDEIFHDKALDFMCYFSSAAAILGDSGSCDYAVGNRFQMAYARHRERERLAGRRQGKTLAINWPLWKDGGMAFGNSEETRLYLGSSGQRALETQDGLEIFARLLGHEGAQHLVIFGEPERVHRFLDRDRRAARKRDAQIAPSSTSASSGRRTEMKDLTVEQCLLWDLKELADQLLRIGRDRLDADENLADFGFDSIGLADFAKSLSHHFSIEMTPAIFFSHPTLARLAAHLLSSHSALLKTFYGEEKTAPAPILPPPVLANRPSSTLSPLDLPRRVEGADAPVSPVANEPVAIIGMSGRFPDARSVDELWQILVAGKDVIREIPAERFDWRKYFGDPVKDPTKTNSRWSGLVPGVAEFDPLFFEISPREAEMMDPRQRLLLQEAWRALEDAGYGPIQVREHQIGVFVGVEQGDYQFLTKGKGMASGNHDGMLAARLSYFLDLHGPTVALNTACSSGLVAAHQACLSLRAGECSTAIAAGVNLLLAPYIYVAMSQSGMLSPHGKCFAFDKRADGMVPGEAVAAVVLKRLSQALADGDPIYAVITGSGINYDGRTNGITAPNGAAQTSLIKEVYRRYQVDPADIEYLVTHGTGTKLGDPVEVTALCDAFQGVERSPGYCALTSTKTNLGHTLAASGLVSLIGLVQALRHETIPASLHCDEENDYIPWNGSPFYVNKAAKPWPAAEKHQRTGAVSSFGASGTNAHMVVTSHDRRIGGDDLAAPPYFLFALSAKTETALQEKIRDLCTALETGAWDRRALHHASYTLLCGRHHFSHRAAVVVKDKEAALHSWKQCGAGEKAPSVFRGKVGRDFQAQPALRRYADGLLEECAARPLSSQQYQENLFALADLYCQGYELSWPDLYGKSKLQRLHLPVYPFARDRYWIQQDEAGLNVSAPQSAAPETKPDPAEAAVAQSRDAGRKELLLVKDWRLQPVQKGKDSAGKVIILTTGETFMLAARLAERLPESRVLRLPDQLASHEPAIDLREYEGVIDLSGCGQGREDSISWLSLMQQWVELGPKEKMMALCVTRGLERHENSKTNLAGALRVALFRALQSEYSKLQSRHMDVDFAMSDQDLVEQVACEFLAGGHEPHVCYRQGRRYSACFKPREIPREFVSVNEMRMFPEDHVLWITGGTRGLGYRCAQHFVRHYGVKRLLLSGREALPVRHEWELYQDQDSAMGRKIRNIQALEAEGAQVEVSAVSLTDADALESERARITKKMGPVGAIIHCAGLAGVRNPALIRKSQQEIQQVMDPKVAGVENLIRCFAHEPLRFFVLFSSISAAVPGLGAGQIDYAMANAYMDYVAEARSSELPIVSIQWPSWKESGIGEVRSKAFRRTGLLSVTDAEGLRILDNILACAPGPVVMPVVVADDGWSPEQLTQGSLPEQAPPEGGRKAEAGVDVVPGPLQAETRQWFLSLVSEQLKIDLSQLDAEAPLPEYGVDSIMLTQLLRAAGAALEVELDPSLLFEYTTIRAFADWLAGKHADALVKLLRPAKAEPSYTEPSTPRSSPAAAAPLRSGSRSAQPNEIAVVGLSCRFPGARNLEEFWELLAEGRTAIRAVPASRWGHANDYYAGLLDDITHFDPKFFLIPEADARVMDPQALLVLEEGLHLIYHAGYSHGELKGQRLGVYLGARSRHSVDDARLASAQNPIMAVGQNYLAANVSRFFDLRGPSLVVDTACSSALVAMNIAIQALVSGEIEGAFVGGISLLHTDATLRMFGQRGILRRDPRFHIFDSRANGALLGEGAGMVMLKTLQQAHRDRDTVYALVKALAINNDGRTNGPTAPNLQAQKEVMEMALARSGRQAEEIGYIAVNGSGSEVTDLLELKAIESVYRKAERARCALGSMKPNIGHPLCAEGIASLIQTVLMLHNRKLVPFLSAEQPMRHYNFTESPFYFVRSLTPWNETQRFAAVNCFADGGTNAHVILESWRPDENQEPVRRPLQPPLLNRIDLSPAPELVSHDSTGETNGRRRGDNNGHSQLLVASKGKSPNGTSPTGLMFWE
jgi:amino acid adenylation domain-containing protein